MSIKINFQGTIFETTIDTLKNINYFKYMIEATNYDFAEPLFVNRSAHIFKHVLAFATDPTYTYPLKYKGELDFYDMVYNVNDLYDPNNEIKNDINTLREYIYTIADMKGIILDDPYEDHSCASKYCNNKRERHDIYCEYCSK